MSDVKKEQEEKQIQDEKLDKVSGGFIHNPTAPAPQFPEAHKPGHAPGPIKPEPM